MSYVVRVALRCQRTSARGPGRRPFSYAPVDPPAWQRYVGSVVEAGDPAAQPVDDLDNPRGVALETGRNRLVVASERNLLLFEHRQTDLPTVSDVISLRTADGEGIGHASRWGLVWDEANTEMYLVAERRDLPGWRARRGNSGCHRLRPRPKGSQLRNDLLIDSGGEHVYVLGERELEVYRRDGAVRFQPGSAVEPEVCPQHGDGTRRRTHLRRRRRHAGDARPGTPRRARSRPCPNWASWRWADDSYSSQVGRRLRGSERDRRACILRGQRIAAGGGVRHWRVAGLRSGGTPPWWASSRPTTSILIDSPTDLRCSVTWPRLGRPRDVRPSPLTMTPRRLDVVCDDQFFTVRWDAEAGDAFVSDWFGCRSGGPVPKSGAQDDGCSVATRGAGWFRKLQLRPGRRIHRLAAGPATGGGESPNWRSRCERLSCSASPIETLPCGVASVPSSFRCWRGRHSRCRSQPWNLWPAALLGILALYWSIYGLTSLRAAFGRCFAFALGKYGVGAYWIFLSAARLRGRRRLGRGHALRRLSRGRFDDLRLRVRVRRPDRLGRARLRRIRRRLLPRRTRARPFPGHGAFRGCISGTALIDVPLASYAPVGGVWLVSLLGAFSAAALRHPLATATRSVCRRNGRMDRRLGHSRRPLDNRRGDRSGCPRAGQRAAGGKVGGTVPRIPSSPGTAP